MAPHSSTLAWKIPWTEEPGRLQSMGLLRVRHDWATSLSLFLSCIGEGNGNLLQCSSLENPRDGGAWWAAVYGVAKSRTRLKRLSSSSSSLLYGLIHVHTWLLEKTIVLIIWTFVSKVMSLLFYRLSKGIDIYLYSSPRFVIALLPRNKHLLISWLQSLSAVILEPKKIKSVTVSTFPPSICHEVMGQHAMILVFCLLSFKPAFSLSSLTFVKRLFSFSSLSAITVIFSVKSYSLTPLFQSHQLRSQAFLLLW